MSERQRLLLILILCLVAIAGLVLGWNIAQE